MFKNFIVSILLVFITSYSLTTNAKSINLYGISDETNSLSAESIELINNALKNVKEKHNVNIKFYLLNDLGYYSESELAKKLFHQNQLNSGDLLFLVAKKEKRSRFWIGSDLQNYFTRSNVRYTLDEILPQYFQEKDYEGAYLKTTEQISKSLGNTKFEYVFNASQIKPESFFWFLLLFITSIFGYLTIKFYTNKKRLAKKYPAFGYEKAKEFEQMQVTKKRFLAILKKEYPNESVYKVYRKLAKEYKENKASGNKVNAKGQEITDYSIVCFSVIPLYVLMFNSPYTSLNFAGQRAHNNGTSSDSSSSCGTSSSCGSSCGGGGCGGGGCGS